METVWSIELLGGFRVRPLREGEQRTITRFRTQKTASLLAYLACHRHRSHPREALIELYWPEAEPESARHSLSLALSSLRNQLEPPGIPAGSVIFADRWSVELNPDAFTTDVLEFEQSLRLAALAANVEARAAHLSRAIKCYQGAFLPGCYDDWALAEQERLAGRFLQAVRQLVALLASRGELPRAVELARQSVTADPLREDLHAELIRLLAASGQPSAALRQYRTLERLLDEELGAEPGPAVRSLAQSLVSEAARQQRSKGAREVGDSTPSAGVAPAPARPSAPAGRERGSPLPTGTVTFLLTDIEGSTARWEREGERFRAALGVHHSLLRREFARHSGHEIKEAGDSFVVAFAAAADAIACAVAAQRALSSADCDLSACLTPGPSPQTSWRRGTERTAPPTGAEAGGPVPPGRAPGTTSADSVTPLHDVCGEGPGVRQADEPHSRIRNPQLRVRMAIHSGDVELEGGEYRGLALHRAARILAVAHGRQILCSEATFALLRRDLETEVRLRDLGAYRLRDVELPERLFQVEYAGMLEPEYPPLRADRATQGNLPLQITRFFGRTSELQELVRLLQPQGSKGAEEQGRAEQTCRPVPTPLPTCALAPLPPESDAPRRLVTLTGPGGTGKTRLAIEAAGRLTAAYSGAVWFVPLADLADPQLLPEATLAALHAEPGSGPAPLDDLVERLSPQPSLLVLDNLEQLVGAGEEPDGAPEFVRTLLERVPDLALMVTSRQLLGLPGEQEFSVAPLPVPAERLWSRTGGPDRAGRPNGPGPSTLDSEPSTLMLGESVRLFVDRAQAVKPDFQVTSGNAPAVAELCSRLEGIPLAIELAAARAQVLTPAQMLQQLAAGPGGRFDLLVSRRRGVTERQRALRATLDWSYRLLSPELQRFFAQLSVFRGGWTVEAAEAVSGGNGVMEYGSDGALGTPDPPDPNTPTLRHSITPSLHHSITPAVPDALDALAQLRECSLVTTEEGPEGFRFRMLETLREYGAEQLAHEERSAATRQHAAYFLSLAEAAEPELRGEQQAAWLDRLEAEHDNFRAVLRWALSRSTSNSTEKGSGFGVHGSDRTDPSDRSDQDSEPRTPNPDPSSETALRLCSALWYFWSIRGHLTEGRRALAEVLDRTGEDEPGPWCARALTGAGALAHDQSDYPAARRLLEESVALWRQVGGDGPGLAHALNCLGNVLLDQDDRDGALPAYQEALGLYREAGDQRGASIALGNLGVLELELGHRDRAADLLSESARLKRKLGNRYGLAMALESLGNLERGRGDLSRAIEYCREALALRRELGHRQGIAMSLNNLGHLLLDTGDLEGARSSLRESLALFHELGMPRGVAESLLGLAGVAAAGGDPVRAARLSGAAAALREAHGFQVSFCERTVEKRWLVAAREALGEQRFAAMEQADWTLCPIDAVDEALRGARV